MIVMECVGGVRGKGEMEGEMGEKKVGLEGGVM